MEVLEEESSSSLTKAEECKPFSSDKKKVSTTISVPFVQLTYQCEVCPQIFYTKSSKTRHVYSDHQPEKHPFLCDLCDKGYMAESSLRQHMVKTHKTERKPFKCSNCTECFTLWSSLEKHVETHKVKTITTTTIIAPVVLPTTKCKTNTNKKLSKKKVKSKKSLSCPNCRKKCSSAYYLNRHLKTHVKESSHKPFDCKTCKKKFSSTDKLKRHNETHVVSRGEFPCDICGKIFAKRYRLTRHLLIHERNNETEIKKISITDFDVKVKSEPVDTVEYEDMAASEFALVKLEPIDDY